MGNAIGFAILGSSLVGTAYLVYCCIFNEKYLRLITNDQEKINKFLSFHGYQLYEYAPYDCAPCQVRFSIFTNDGSSIPSRVFGRLLRGAMRGSQEDLDELVYRCVKARVKHDKSIMKNKLSGR